MKYRLISVILMVVISFSFVSANVFASESVLPSGIPDSEIPERIDSYIEENKDTTAGVSIAVFRGEEILYKTGYGYANIEEQLVVNEDTVYEWGSVSKLLVWVSVMQLLEQGKIDLDVDVQEYLPENFFTRLKYKDPITMKHLMNHNAGWEDAIFQMCAIDSDSILPLDQALKTTEPRQINKPGKVCAYSNWGVALAGYIVERISGLPFYQYVQDNIFKPLNIEHTAVSPQHIDVPWVKTKLLESEGYTSNLSPIGDGLFNVNIYPAGSTAGTLNDFLAFAKALVPNSEGSKKLFDNDETHNVMFTATLKFPGTEIDYNNHGFWSHEYNVQALGHGGNTIMNSSYLLIDPVSGVGIVIMTNQSSETIYTYGLPPMIFGELGQMSHEEGRRDVSDIKGFYYSGRLIKEGIGKMYSLTSLRFFMDDGNNGLLFNMSNILKIEGKQIAPNTFVLTQQTGGARMDSVSRYSNIDGRNMMSAIYGDTHKLDAEMAILYISFVLYVIALLWSIVTLISNLIGYIIRKIKKDDKPNDSFKKYQIILCIAIILLLFIIIGVASMMLTMEAVVTKFIPYVIASILLGIIPLVYAIIFFKKKSTFSCTKGQKVSYVITMFMGFIMTIAILALEMYKI